MTRVQALSLIAFILNAPAIMAQPVIEAFDRFEMNWSNMRLRYYGESAPHSNLELAEKEATDQGLLYALSSIAKIRAEKGVPVENAGDIAHAVSKQSYVFNTVYFSNGKVRTELESSLALALDPGRKPYVAPSSEAESPTSSSVVILVKGLSSPTLLTEIYDESGELAYGSQDVHPDAYRKNLIGRWFYQNSSELRAFSGAAPVQIEADYSNGKVLVSKEAWAEVRKSSVKHLRDAKVAFVLPKP